MNDRLALMVAIIANPEEDTPRLAFADWLQEHGDEHDHARADFIRLQCELVRMGFSDPKATQLRRRETLLAKKHVKHWLGPLAQSGKQKQGAADFERGLLAWWWAWPRTFLTKAHQTAVASFPHVGVQRLAITGYTRHVNTVVSSPALEWVSELRWYNSRLTDAGVSALAGSDRLYRLPALWLGTPACSDRGLQALAASEALPRLRWLSLSEVTPARRITPAGLCALLTSTRLPALDKLWVVDSPRMTDVLATVVGNAAVRRLRSLYLRGNVPARAVCRTRELAALEDLRLEDFELTDEDAIALTENPVLGGLRTIRLQGVKSGSGGLLGPEAVHRLQQRFETRLTLHHVRGAN